MGQKQVIRFKDWSRGILKDIDYADAPVDSLTSCTNFKIKNGYLTAIKTPALEQTLSNLTSPKRAFITHSRYDVDGNIGSTDYLYVYDRNGGGGDLVRFYRDYGDTTWVYDSGFKVDLAGSATDIDFAVLGDTLATAGSGYQGEIYAHPYNEYRFNNALIVKGWLTNNNLKPSIAHDSVEANVDSALNSDGTKFGIYYKFTSVTSYTAGDNVEYYISFKNHAGYETEPYNFISVTDTSDFAGYNFTFKATSSLATDWKEVILYKELNGGGKYFLGSCDMNEGFIQDFSNSGTVLESNAGWSSSSSIYSTNESLSDEGIYNQPYDYTSERNGADKLPSACIAAFKGRFLFGGEGSETDGTRFNAVYVSGTGGIGSLYEDNYLTINDAGGRKIKTIKTFGNYILVFYSEMVVILDGSHPSPSMWKVIGTFANGVDSDRAVRRTNTGIIFANENSVYIFNGKFQDIVHKYNKSIYESFVDAGSNDIVVTYNSVENLILIAGRSYMLALNEAGALNKIDNGLNANVLIEGETYSTRYIDDSYNIYAMFTGSIASGSIESHKIIFDQFNDKMLFKVIIRLNSSSSTTANYNIELDGISALSGAITVNGETREVIMCKNRFKTLKYSITNFSGDIEEISVYVGARKENRFD